MVPDALLMGRDDALVAGCSTRWLAEVSTPGPFETIPGFTPDDLGHQGAAGGPPPVVVVRSMYVYAPSTCAMLGVSDTAPYACADVFAGYFVVP